MNEIVGDARKNPACEYKSQIETKMEIFADPSLRKERLVRLGIHLKCIRGRWAVRNPANRDEWVPIATIVEANAYDVQSELFEANVMAMEIRS